MSFSAHAEHFVCQINVLFYFTYLFIYLFWQWEMWRVFLFTQVRFSLPNLLGHSHRNFARVIEALFPLSSQNCLRATRFVHVYLHFFFKYAFAVNQLF